MERTVRRPTTTSRRAYTGRNQGGGVTLGPRVIRYGFPVGKEAESFAELLGQVIDTWYDGNISAFTRAAGLKTSSAVTRWRSGQRPTIEMLRQIAPAMHITARKLEALVYPQGEPRSIAAAPPAVTHPLAREIDRLLGDTSPLADAEKDRLTTVVDSVVEPYRGRRRKRTA